MLAYVGLLSLAALAIGAAVAGTQTLPNMWAVVGLAAMAVAAERGSVRLSNTTESSIALLPTLLAAVLFGPLAAMIVAASSQLGDLRPPYLKWPTYTAIRAITGAGTGLAALATASAVHGVSGIVLATVVGAAVAEMLDVAFTALTHRVRRN
ncbi:MAG TPA: ECF transporter S component, partial [Gaiellaceae bacterium]|nr:ECF transporter S component [Gaiellaceae bacterium]